jgi:hypothetical protein
MGRTGIDGTQITDESIQDIDCDSSIEKTINKGKSLGYAPLDIASKIPLIHLPDFGGIFYLTMFELCEENNIRQKEDITGSTGIFEINLSGDIQPTISNTIDELFENFSGNITIKDI